MTHQPKITDIKLTKKQSQAMRTLCTDNGIDYLLFGGAARGAKSWLGCVWEFSMCMAYAGVRYFIGRNELKRLKMTTLRTMFKALAYYGFEAEVDYHYHAGDNVIMFPNGSGIDLLDLKFLPSDPLYERFGSTEYTGGWIEEAGEVDFGAFDVLKSRVGQCLNDEHGIPAKILITANPKKNWLYTYFYLPWKNDTLPKNMSFIQALVSDNPYAQAGTQERLLNIKIKSQRERLANGNWEYSDEPNQVISYDQIYSCLGRIPEGDNIKIKHNLGVDVARFGDDSSCITEIKDSVLVSVEKIDGARTTDIASRINVKVEAKGILSGNIKVDGDGLGAGVLDALHDYHKITAYEIHSGGRATKDPDKEFELPYTNLRTQLWFEFRNMIVKGQFGIAPELEESEIFQELLDDITSIKYNVVRDKEIALEPKEQAKKRLGRSPDTGDAVVYGTCNLQPFDDVFFEVI